MVAEKTCVSGYFTNEIDQLVTKYADRNRITKSKALEALVEAALTNNKEKCNTLTGNDDIEALRKDTFDAFHLAGIRERNLIRTAEKLERQIAELQTEVDKLSREYKA